MVEKNNLKRKKNILNKLNSASLNASEESISNEVVNQIIKSDISEEIDRLDFHKSSLSEELASKKAKGKKIDFILLEMLREVNTILAKVTFRKTSIIKNVIKILNDENKKSKFSVSHTTRLPREGDIDGSDYFFVSKEIFDELYEAGNFIETAEVHDYKYGTSKDFIYENINQGINVFLEIDVQGFQKLRNRNIEFRSMFILPPTIEELRKRIQKRGLDSEDVIEKRMKNALKELSEAEEYDYLVINDVFEHAIEELLEMIINKGFKDQTHDKKLKILQDLLS